MEFEFLLPEHNRKKLSLTQHEYRNANDVGDVPKMKDFCCIHPDPADSLEFRSFPEFTVDVSDVSNLSNNLLEDLHLEEPHLFFKPIPCESSPSTPRAKEKAAQCEEENKKLIDNMNKTWNIESEVPFTTGRANPLIYLSNIDVESRLRGIDYKTSKLNMNKDYSTEIQSYEPLFREETNPYVTGGKREVNDSFNKTSIGFTGNRELFGESTKRKTIME